ncbi:large subunit ribosomal protein L9 [Fusobacterium naviforme]|uniref:Large ribosomal subunit protein bL9 n=1 Tax=Moryella indoligenes TaxID=371674 RepID=A0AAE3VAL1_9FIRM|nr:50S ribosomal protein L9 [Moryella indoligenes]KAB0577618.1 50S ribosomal protein L9 [Fusobacterium naviforme]MDQ0152806.1 large subunit ribosomal protein L9 [Moryella indoligenes]PSL10435.1 large subunit ribosomal protein L9 [Fusobacterium naviforme]STO28132.1 50S ribosomal protein L9 [Fusobacterium naviforme]
MKIVLLQDVKSLGKAGALVEVSEGYARNFLLPKKLGAPATAENLNTLKLKKANADRIAAEQLAEAQALAKRLEAAEVKLAIKGGENGKTYGSVSTKEIAEAVKQQLSLEIDRKKIVLAEPIKSFGSFETAVKLHKDVQAKLKVQVVEA